MVSKSHQVLVCLFHKYTIVLFKPTLSNCVGPPGLIGGMNIFSEVDVQQQSDESATLTPCTTGALSGSDDYGEYGSHDRTFETDGCAELEMRLAKRIKVTDDTECYFDWLPQDLIVHILSFLGKEVCVAWWVCKTWREVCLDRYLWDRLAADSNNGIRPPDILDYDLVPEPCRMKIVNSSTFKELIMGPPFLDKMDWMLYTVDRFKSDKAEKLFSIIEETADLRVLGNNLIPTWRVYWKQPLDGWSRQSFTRFAWTNKSRQTYSAPDLTTNYSAKLFVSKVLYMCAVRVKHLCEEMRLPRFMHEQVYATVTFSLKDSVGLLQHRTLDHLTLCSVYILCKANQLNCSFRKIIDDFRNLPNVHVETYRKVSLYPKSSKEDDVIAFYNELFLPSIRGFVVDIRSSDAHRREDHLSEMAFALIYEYETALHLPLFIIHQTQSVVTHIIDNEAEILENRHVDQIVMCAIYVVVKINNEFRAQSEGISFSDIIHTYSSLRGNADMYRRVWISDDNYKDIISFYNDIFICKLRGFLLSLKCWPPELMPAGQQRANDV